MEANELRIGNYLKKEHYPTIWKLEMFLGNEVCSVINTHGYDYHEPNIKDLQPIELTEEWLIKSKFTVNKYHDEFTLKEEHNTFLLDCEYTDKGVFNLTINGVKFPIEIKHVHQLQNLYFALTGKELDIK